ncbi:MAE_28990/MAE_18760 family HEPN-like nuclease [Janthinobacterium sp. SUN033]|uniref:MAE_28990/MAE_18760 family HEPN-like nuclease n=1 Tax=Janthinobacterium sp. SUN033 TaxID=3002439 RepID=UPI0025AF9CFE|nr:MAE_28990/MAE_18760 family HEPN-like nuclease [Janthinobacterium sp. SUN033]MDN2675621.1 MAE_28990/MAE_18760 family HEPN-like nuclease [Janthinobacterium sp. SUN033]
MSDIKTLTQLQDALDKEMGWRVKEIGAFRFASKSVGQEKKFFIRAGVAILYAHWEGFVKNASEHYLNYINNQGHTYRELQSCFSLFGLKGKLQTLVNSRKSGPNLEAFNFIFSELEKKANLNMSSAIDTESNLTSKVFSNIAASLDINTASYATKFNLIDESLVHKRNKVAHGEYLDLGGREFGELVEEVLQLMREYKTDIENAASMKKYIRSIPNLLQA